MDKKRNMKRRIVDLPECKYGLTCYQKNSEHWKKYRHPTATYRHPTATDESTTSKDENDNSEVIIDVSSQEVKPSTDETSSNQVVSPLIVGETIKVILKSMPQDFFDFWDFCCSVNKAKPDDAFAEIGLHLVGTYDLLSKYLPKDKTVSLHCHWRYFYDPPEFQTVVKRDGEDLYHIGYFRDYPSEFPAILASNSAAVGPKLTLMGDNIFAAINKELTAGIKKLKTKKLQMKFLEIQSDLQNFAVKRKYSLETETSKTKARHKKVVAKTFHGLGIVVPVKNDVGYRPLPDSNATLKNILNKIAAAEDEKKRMEKEEALDEIITNVHFANDECDYGMGLELGIDLFCFGNPCLNKQISFILPLAYDLLKRSIYGEIVKVHIKNRKKGHPMVADI